MFIGKKEFPAGNRPYLVGILNATPDSFYDNGSHEMSDDCAARIQVLAREGADIIDIGGESSRPGSRPVDESIELARVLPAIAMAVKTSTIPVSIDTCKASVAAQALRAGAVMVNDISALRADPRMTDLVREARVPVVLMHIQGTPATMQDNPLYTDPVREVSDFLLSRAATAEQEGIAAENIILDPGIGFGKRLEDNLLLLKGFCAYINNRYPVLIGHSRKSFIGAVLNRPKPAGRLFGSIGAALAAVQNGAAFLRVHDVQATRDALAVYGRITMAGIEETINGIV
ncbi:MAG: dihydropteroate synthase [Candidatus Raymondbacteria bacterium RifOxyC12_full_50_8]|uniref:Dihydropteroate synthase n=1 Tax=Candidatus Raymondbacteria bacterium RIFOXYD12_FULL_49_13 TaxID=1817890 RepID=A0A1F7FC61_UNCRA|nr:MAG: dihydropteroate synthase [Candidatus Raymondbacteria bacterium RIFOXYA2_FULL_49_16]OGJ93471.1 MAG: dihydropteroate synthase [Candidatus Raymondbacteria bacterium RifOxyB12_full_50_8]OGK04270.1 MAG: dihydropteroate synthase [Candidatus Raymondbacteria bacterium RIFOXYD12_FULL_49_13]OGK06044.1 MAG: dihydropteroate synthase [Candidatus Raymondbacteria bacterium RifOxyC12_full_50_8]OGP42447.1 MAG: dihydropteroate synthase [Candidatus Raymondbacteria bacterium RIFOXYB2_FULL_49_35]